MKKALGPILVYAFALVLAVLFYMLPEWTGNAWLWDRVVGSATLGLVCVFSIVYLARVK